MIVQGQKRFFGHGLKIILLQAFLFLLVFLWPAKLTVVNGINSIFIIDGKTYSPHAFAGRKAAVGSGYFGPCLSSIGAFVDGGSVAVSGEIPRFPVFFPGCGKLNSKIARHMRHVYDPRGLIHKKGLRPLLPSIAGNIHPTFIVGRIQMPRNANHHVIGVRRVD